MLTYRQALNKIRNNTPSPKARLLPLNECLDQVLAQDIYSPLDLPSFDNSAVDGYAVGQTTDGRRQTTEKKKVIGEIGAGKTFESRLKKGEAVRIFTGAPVPKGAYAVAMQENVERVNGTVALLKDIEAKENIRFRGEDIRQKDLLLKKGARLGPAHLALLAAVGFNRARVFPPLVVSILATGSELIQPGELLRPGKIFDSNSILLEALVREMGAIPKILPHVQDDPEKIRRAVREGLKSDLLLIAGGVSVGEYDFVKAILKEEGVREIFWKVDIKPGKPLFFGTKKQTVIFGLPGNPVSVYVTFEEFVKPALLKMQGKQRNEAEVKKGRLAKDYRNGSRFHFVRVNCMKGKEGYAITPLKGQGSHMIGSLAKANAILAVEPHVRLRKNDCVSVKMMGKD